MDRDELLAALWRDAMASDGPDAEFVIRRELDEPGRSFSAESMSAVVDSVTTWIGTRVMRRWQATNEPPTYLRVTVHVDVG